MSDVFRNIDPSPPNECVPPCLWCKGDKLAGWRGGGVSIVRKTHFMIITNQSKELQSTIHPFLLTQILVIQIGAEGSDQREECHLLTVETEMNEDSKSTNERGPFLVSS
jgi:hypothetical protein